jgi:hypothetical protein
MATTPKWKPPNLPRFRREGNALVHTQRKGPDECHATVRFDRGEGFDRKVWLWEVEPDGGAPFASGWADTKAEAKREALGVCRVHLHGYD